MVSKRWQKLGLVRTHQMVAGWWEHSAMTPTPVLLEDRIRVYLGARDKAGVSRIACIDVARDNPLHVLDYAKMPVLDIGQSGCFDDNGVILGDLIQTGNELRLYYVGFQLVKKVKFLAFTGLATSNDGGNHFKRLSQTPILDRSDEGIYIRALHSILFEEGVYKAWYAVGSKWTYMDDKPFPSYYIKYLESKDGIHFATQGMDCIDCEGSEYRIGRPRVYGQMGNYTMYYTKGTLEKDYMAGIAYSDDGKVWRRDDRSLGIEKSQSGWDTQMLCYPAIIATDEQTYMFYNGNDMGFDGFGVAVLTEGA